MRHRTPQFGHAFSSDGYSAGYYSYLWSDVITADAAEATADALEDGGRVVQFDNSGTGDHAWQLIDRGAGGLTLRNGHSGKVLGVEGASTANSARCVQDTDDGAAHLRWERVDQGDGWFLLRNRHSGKVLGVDGMSTSNSAQVVQYEDNGTADHLWRLI